MESERVRNLKAHDCSNTLLDRRRVDEMSSVRTPLPHERLPRLEFEMVGWPRPDRVQFLERDRETCPDELITLCRELVE